MVNEIFRILYRKGNTKFVVLFVIIISSGIIREALEKTLSEFCVSKNLSKKKERTNE